MLLAALGFVLIDRLRALTLEGTELAKAQVDTVRVKLLKLAAVLTRNTRRIRLYLASKWPSAAVFAQAMSTCKPFIGFASTVAYEPLFIKTIRSCI
jgi:hypothetical protein